ncbi:methyltransferase 21A-like isoform 1 [Thraustotheca clavata]|uniref:Methyltransferase 21A-like isoform 1 n=1 Tax=Thraustotheca clavata TaxID=74557 RepID=A0A1V9ZGK2_9STRA|nr:methyltransferase 21A-like isoform 1 [Thraustotheca clavata]
MELSSIKRELTYAKERHFNFAIAGYVKIIQDITQVSGTVWDASIVLSHYLDSLGTITLEGKTILEIGAGTALPSIVGARLGAIVIATDLIEALEYTNRAIEANCTNNILGAIQTQELAWGANGYGLKALETGSYEFIVGADVVYNERYFTELRDTLQTLSCKNTKIIIACEQRRKDLTSFWALCEPYFHILLLFNPMLEYYCTMGKVYLYQLTPKNIFG